MTVWTVHLREGRAPVLVPERFSLWAAVLGPVWLAWHRAWIPAVLVLSAWLALGVLAEPWRGACLMALGIWVGMAGQDMRRWSLDRRGFRLAHVVTGRDADAALVRLMDAVPNVAAAESGRLGLRGAAA